MQVAICAFEKLKVVIVLDHAICKKGLAKVTTMTARSIAVISHKNNWCCFPRGWRGILRLIGKNVQSPSIKREKGKAISPKLCTMAFVLVTNGFDTISLV